MPQSFREQVADIQARIVADPKLAADPRVVALLESLVAAIQANPLESFEPHRCRACGEYENRDCAGHSVPQRDFLSARTAIIAAFAGNQFGKTTSLVVRAGLECLPIELVPEHLREFKTLDGPSFGWILCPSEDKIYDSLLPAFREWMPVEAFAGRSIDKGWNGNRAQLSFKNGSQITFKTYKQDPSTLGGARLHWVGYDEPPPRKHRDEAMTRLLRYGGYEMFAMTPLETNTGWIRRDIFKRREAEHITVVRASMHDNPTLPEARKQQIIAEYPNDIWRAARVSGEFVDVGGLIYDGFEGAVKAWENNPPARTYLQDLDIVVAIDPGVRNAGIIFGGFDTENILWVFDELLLQDKTPSDYAKGIWDVLRKWGIPRSKAGFVIDPAARQRNQTNAETVESMLAREGVYCEHGQNNVDAGIQQVRVRLQQHRLRINPECRGLRDEADEYAAEDRDDGEFRPIKQNDHRLDALRYLAMRCPYDPVVEEQAPTKQLGWEPGQALPGHVLVPTPDYGPMGAMS